MRSIFRGFTYYYLLEQMSKAGAKQGITLKYPAALLALVYFALLAVGRLSGLLWVLSVLSPLALVPAQQFVNSLNANSPTPINDKFTLVNWVFIALGAILLLAALYGSFFASP